jgi:hypothetical protein
LKNQLVIHKEDEHSIEFIYVTNKKTQNDTPDQDGRSITDTILTKQNFQKNKNWETQEGGRPPTSYSHPAGQDMSDDTSSHLKRHQSRTPLGS